MRHLLLVTALCAASTALAPQAEAQVKVMAWSRPRIGVVVDVKPDSAQDKLGARIREVTPGGPADKAGLEAGDIVTRFNGTALGGVKSEDDDESGPGNKLIDLAHALDTGDTVKVEYRRGAETRKATLVGHRDERYGTGPRVHVPGPGHARIQLPDAGDGTDAPDNGVEGDGRTRQVPDEDRR